jgi:hypothetical protein
MAVAPFHRSPEEYEALLRGEMRRRQERGLPGQGLPRAFMPPVGQPAGLASRPGPNTMDPGSAAGPAPTPTPAPAQAPVARPQPAAMPDTGGTPLEERGKGWQYADAIFSAFGSGGNRYDQSYYDKLDADRLTAHKADPNSAASAQMRKAMGPTLAKLGLDATDIAMLSAADISAMAGKGDLVMAVAEARQKAAAAKEKAAADAQALADERAYEERQSSAKTKAEQEEWDRRNAIEAPQRLERARTIGGMATGRMIQGALLSDELQRGRAGEADQRKREAELREEARKKREMQVKAEQDAETKLINEELSLDKLEKKLSARAADESLPGQGNVVERAFVGAKAKVAGGSGMSPDDTSLDTDLTAAGLQAYIGTAGNAPNSEREQNVAATLFRGNGTVGSALERVRERKAEIARKKAALKARAAGGTDAIETGAVEVDASGDEWEDVP